MLLFVLVGAVPSCVLGVVIYRFIRSRKLLFVAARVDSASARTRAQAAERAAVVAEERRAEAAGLAAESLANTGEALHVARQIDKLDAAAVSALRARIAALVAQGCRAVVVDLGATQRIDRSGLVVLAGGHRRLRGCGGALAVAAASGPVTRALQACGLDRALRLHPTVEAAAAAAVEG